MLALSDDAETMHVRAYRRFAVADDDDGDAGVGIVGVVLVVDVDTTRSARWLHGRATIDLGTHASIPPPSPATTAANNTTTNTTVAATTTSSRDCSRNCSRSCSSSDVDDHVGDLASGHLAFVYAPLVLAARFIHFAANGILYLPFVFV